MGCSPCLTLLTAIASLTSVLISPIHAFQQPGFSRYLTLKKHELFHNSQPEAADERKRTFPRANLNSEARQAGNFRLSTDSKNVKSEIADENMRIFSKTSYNADTTEAGNFRHSSNTNNFNDFSLLNSSSPPRVDSAGVDNVLYVKLKQPSLRAIHKRLVDNIIQSTSTKDRSHYVSKRSLDEVSDSSTSEVFSGETGLEKQRDQPYNEIVDNNEGRRGDKNSKEWFAGNDAGTQPEDLELMLDDGFMLVPLDVLEANLDRQPAEEANLQDRQPVEDMEDKATPYGGRLDGWSDRSVEDMISMLKRGKIV